ncbi:MULTISPECIES: hypothetical protein [unclassified Endozoicomonas]|uniref:hypothetical protein n=1 Tax=unclassified Endozoicomonas TaxID=2644528 RepID=UPI002147449A|nr:MULTISPECIES: hypothetical protein [unclassified Endozoicomonas]
MKVLLAIPVGLLLSGFLSTTFAAEVTFRDETVGMSYGFSATAPGFEHNALRYFRKVGGLAVTIDSVINSGVYLPVSTNISFQNVNNDLHPTDARYPQGSVGWSFDSPDVYQPTYTFTIFAGGRFYYPNEQPYMITLSVDGRDYGPVKTNEQSNWSPTYFSKVSFSDSSKMIITLSPIAHNQPQGGEH